MKKSLYKLKLIEDHDEIGNRLTTKQITCNKDIGSSQITKIEKRQHKMSN